MTNPSVPGDILEHLEKVASEIRSQQINGWGNSIDAAADEIESLRAQLAERDAKIAALLRIIGEPLDAQITELEAALAERDERIRELEADAKRSADARVDERGIKMALRTALAERDERIEDLISEVARSTTSARPMTKHGGWESKWAPEDVADAVKRQRVYIRHLESENARLREQLTNAETELKELRREIDELNE